MEVSKEMLGLASSQSPVPKEAATSVAGGISVVKDNRFYAANSRISNGVSAPHMLGNQLNPTSSMAQKMSDTLTAELEAHHFGAHASAASNNVVGVPFPVRAVSPLTKVSGVPAGGAPFPESLEQLLERQWQQGSQFLMEQAQHFDSKFPSLTPTTECQLVSVDGSKRY